MCHMKKATIRELHLHTGSIVSEAAEGSVITILKRGVPVAELRPVQRTSRPKGFLDRDDWRSKFPKVRGDSGRFLEEDRS
jgi:antitoxin (DNA-binding transcriptional repressor) of toxin-antitoxin stability system